MGANAIASSFLDIEALTELLKKKSISELSIMRLTYYTV